MRLRVLWKVSLTALVMGALQSYSYWILATKFGLGNFLPVFIVAGGMLFIGFICTLLDEGYIWGAVQGGFISLLYPGMYSNFILTRQEKNFEKNSRMNYLLLVPIPSIVFIASWILGGRLRESIPFAVASWLISTLMVLFFGIGRHPAKFLRT